MTLGQKGYEAYAASTGGKTYDGRDMPTWAQVKERSPKVAQAWEDAARTIARAVFDSVKDAEPIPETQPAPAGYPANIPSEAPTKRTLG